MAGFLGYGVLDTAWAVCGVVVGGLFLENLGEGIKRTGKKIYYINGNQALKTIFTGLCLTLSLLYVCEIPYNPDYLSYGLIVGMFAVGYQEYQVRQARGLKVHFDVILLNDGSYSIGTNSMNLEVQEGIRELRKKHLRDHQELTDRLFKFLEKYGSRSPEDVKKCEDIVVTVDRIKK